MELSQDLDTLKTEIKTMKGLKLAPGVAPFKTAKNSSNNSVTYVRVALTQNRGEVHEFPTDENGNLSFTAVNAVYPGVNALKFESKETRSTRLCRKIGDIFEPPEDGWGDRLYFAHSPLSQTTSLSSQGMSTSNASTLTGTSGISSGGNPFGQTLFPNYLTPTTNNLFPQGTPATTGLTNNLFPQGTPTTSLQGSLANNLFTQGSLFK